MGPSDCHVGVHSSASPQPHVQTPLIMFHPRQRLKERSAVGHLHDVCFGLHHIGNVDISQTQQSVVVPCLYRLAVHFVLPALILARSHSVASPIHRRYQTYERSFTPQPRPFPSKSQAMLLIVITMSAWMYYPRAK
ncbi:hypothetical protein PV10_00126 [Exophiala mesophila]|uniref:Uncharacterized protein n=1 Tax=Exophiala mesophila TaxID=212818 RepID=A0A0D1X368_EXOME|nr:uncharacterized protein PV10_00126 [Exophiala mesophila]KIV96235.1 hypothetical protein PV10_00126 [Exophiala mesophila]